MACPLSFRCAKCVTTTYFVLELFSTNYPYVTWEFSIIWPYWPCTSWHLELTYRFAGKGTSILKSMSKPNGYALISKYKKRRFEWKEGDKVETQHINPKVDPNTHILLHLVASCFPTTHLYPHAIHIGWKGLIIIIINFFFVFKLCFYGPNLASEKHSFLLSKLLNQQ